MMTEIDILDIDFSNVKSIEQVKKIIDEKIAEMQLENSVPYYDVPIKDNTVIGAVSYYGTGYTCKPYRGAELRIKTALEIEGM